MWKIFKNVFGNSDRFEDIESNVMESEEIAIFNLESVKKNLIEEGLDEERVNYAIEKIKKEITEKVSEKRTLEYGDFINTISSTLNGLYLVPNNRLRLAYQLEDFVECNPEVSNSAMLYASYITYGAAEIQLSEYKAVLSTEDTNRLKEAKKVIDEWEKKSKIKRLIYKCAKDVVIYGDAYLEKIYNKSQKIVGLAYIPVNSIYPKISPYGTVEKFYQVIDTESRFADMENDEYIQKLLSEKKVIEFNPQEILHFNDGSPVGMSDSPIKNLLVQWRLFKLLEEALIIHRITRARRFFIFFLDVTGKTKKQIKRAIMNFTNTLKKVFRIKIEDGEIHGTKSILPPTADLVVPITKDSATKVQVLSSDPTAVRVDDLKFYTHRVTNNLLTSHIFSPEKTGKEEYIERAFIRRVRIYQKHLSYTLEDLYKQVLFEHGFNDVEVSIVFPSPDTGEETKIIDSVVRRMMVVNQLIATTGIVPPTAWIVDYVFKDMTQLEVKQLINMLKFAEKEQEEAAAGEEYPSVIGERFFNKWMEETEEEENIENEEEYSNTLPINLVDEFLTNYKKKQVKLKEKKQKELQSAIKLYLEYLSFAGRKTTPVKEVDTNY